MITRLRGRNELEKLLHLRPWFSRGAFAEESLLRDEQIGVFSLGSSSVETSGQERLNDSVELEKRNGPTCPTDEWQVKCSIGWFNTATFR